MIPVLFEQNTTDFSTNGIGRLAAASCKVTEARNGQFDLEMEVPVTAKYADQIAHSRIIYTDPGPGRNNQPFRIWKINKPVNGMFKVYAEHVTQELSSIQAMPFSITASSAACAQALAGLKANASQACPFDFWTNVTTISSYAQKVPASIKSRLGGVEGSSLDQFGGEFEWDGYTVKLWNHRGVQTPVVTLRYGKDIIDLDQEENIANVITGIVPYWTDSEGTELVTLPEMIVESPTAANYPFKRTVSYDFSGAFEEKPTVAQLRAKAQAYISRSGIGIPDVSIKVTFVNLADTEEYKNIAPLQHVKLCDIIGIEFEPYGISTTAKVVKTVYDCLKEQYESIEIGSIRSNLATTINDTNNAIQGLANETKVNFGKMSNEMQERIDQNTAWLLNGEGYVVFETVNGHFNDILIMDTPDKESAHNVWRMGIGGMGISHNGADGPYDYAWLIDGSFNASYILTGILRGATGDNYWNMDTGEFRLSGSSLLKNSSSDYTQAYKPTTSNYPASEWTTDEQKQANIGKTFYDSSNGKSYVWKKTNNGVKLRFSDESKTEANYDYAEVYYVKTELPIRLTKSSRVAETVQVII